MNKTRRDFLKQASVAGIGFLGLKNFAANPLFAGESPVPNTAGFGPLVPGFVHLPVG